jgi:hypothetical protein
MVSRRLQAGTVWINTYGLWTPLAVAASSKVASAEN